MAGNRIRSVRPELLEHPRFAALSDGAVRLWTGLLSCWDDEGRSLGSVAYIAGRVYFARAKSKATIARELSELEGAGWLKRYQVAGIDYMSVTGWSDPDSECYQYIKAPRPSKLPAHNQIPWPKPCANDGATTDGNSGAKAWSLDQDQDQDQDQEGEGEGEGEQEAARSPSAPRPVVSRPNGGDREQPELWPSEASPPASRAKRPPSGDLHRVIDAFDKRYRDRYGHAPTWGPKQTAMVKQLLGKHPADEIIRRIGILFDSPPAFLAASAPDLGTLVQHFDKLVAPAARAGLRSTPLQNLLDDIARREAAGET